MSIVARGIAYEIEGRPLFAGVTVTAEPGQVIALTGPSGSGKTTLLNILGLLVKPTSGEIRIDRDDQAVAWSDRRRRRFWKRRASFIYQDYGLIDDQTAAYNVTLRAPRLLGRRTSVDPQVDAVLAQVGLAGRGARPVSVLSGGEKQRVAVARALWKQAAYIFADEPTASLDADNRRAITELLVQAAANGASVIISTHDEQLAEASHTRIHLEDFAARPHEQLAAEPTRERLHA